MNDYKEFSYYFDQIMELIDYNKWRNFIKKYVSKDKSILDLACGSGTLISLLCVDGYKVDGLDLSENMIELANDKMKAYHILNNLYVKDMTNFNFEKKYDVISCFFDSVNHLPSIKDVKNMMNSVYNSLNDDGLFIFDLFTYSKYKEMNKTKVHEDFDDFSYTWKMKTSKDNILIHDIKIKAQKHKIHEHYNEYYYRYNDFIDLNKFKIVSITSDFKDTFSDDDERILIVLKKAIE